MNDSLLGLLSYLAQQFGGSTGWAIVSLSLGIRVALLPLTLRLARRGLHSQQLVRKLQPEVDALKQKLAKHPEQVFAETMKLYRKHGHSPFDVPVLLGTFAQLPIFALLYRAIGSVLSSGEKFYWIRSLASPDGWLTALVLSLTAASAYFVPSMSEGTRSMMITLQVGITLFVVWKLAAGYGLYWASSSAIGLVQNLWLRREYARQRTA